MRLELHTLLEIEKIEGNMSAVIDSVTQGKTEPLFTEGCESLEFKDLEGIANAFDGGTGEPGNHFALLYSIALMRDAKYSHASSKYMRALGDKSALRNAFSLGKAALDSNLIGSEE